MARGRAMVTASGRTRTQLAVIFTVLDVLISLVTSLLWLFPANPMAQRSHLPSNYTLLCQDVVKVLPMLPFVRILFAFVGVAACRHRVPWTVMVSSIASIGLAVACVIVCGSAVEDPPLIALLVWTVVAVIAQTVIWRWFIQGMFTVSLHDVDPQFSSASTVFTADNLSNFERLRPLLQSDHYPSAVKHGTRVDRIDSIGQGSHRSRIESLGEISCPSMPDGDAGSHRGGDRRRHSRHSRRDSGSGSDSDETFASCEPELDAGHGSSAAHRRDEVFPGLYSDGSVFVHRHRDLPWGRRWHSSLSANERLHLSQLRHRVRDLHEAGRRPEETSDPSLMRFLVARRFDVSAAEAMVRGCVEWKESFDVDAITWDEIQPELAQGKLALSPLRTLQDQVPIWIGCLHRHWPNAETIERTTRTGIKLVEETVKKCERPNDKFAFIVDCKGFAMVQTDWALLHRVAHLLQNYYPERLGIVFILNEPWYIKPVWAFFQKLIDERTRKRFHFLGGNYAQELEGLCGTSNLCEIMGTPPPWCPGPPLDGSFDPTVFGPNRTSGWVAAAHT